jgi:hypothetical protein
MLYRSKTERVLWPVMAEVRPTRDEQRSTRGRVKVRPGAAAGRPLAPWGSVSFVVDATVDADQPVVTYDQAAAVVIAVRPEAVEAASAPAKRGGGRWVRWKQHADAERGDGSRSMGGKDEPLRRLPWSDRDADPNRQPPS